MKNISKMLNSAERFKILVDELLGRVEVKDAGEHRVASILFLTIAEQYSATLHLVRGGFSSHAPTMAKSMLEALVNLQLIVMDSSHADQMRYKDASENIRLFNDYAKDPEVQQDKAIIQTLTEWKTQAEVVFNELRANGFKKKNIEDEFERAGLNNNYIAYRVYCATAHNQLTTLKARHAGVPILRYHEEAPAESTASLLTSIVSILGRAVQTLPTYTTATEEDVRKVVDDAEESWEEFLAS